MNNTTVLAAALTAGLVALASCDQRPHATRSPDAAGRPRLVILYATCTLNKDYLAPYDAAVPYTPHLERFAERATVFTRHRTEAGQSGIAFASILTGSQADHHTIFRHPIKLPDDVYLVSEAYSDAGYETFFWNAHAMASPELNFAQGVPSENRFFPRPRGFWSKLFWETPDTFLKAHDPRFIQILENLQSDPDYKAFVFTNFSVTHGPYSYDQAAAFAQRYRDQARGIAPHEIDRYNEIYQENPLGLSWNFPETVARLGLSDTQIAKLADVVELIYKSNVEKLDGLFGALVDEIERRGLTDESLIAFTADHGELLYREHALFQWSHSMQLPSDVLDVPLLIRAPHVDRRTYDGVTRSIDVFPTLAGLSDLRIPEDESVDGVDLSPALRGELPDPRLRAYSHTTVLVRSVYDQMQEREHLKDWALTKQFFPSEDPELMWGAVRDGDTVYKLRNLDGTRWGFQAFDLAADPHETRDLYDPESPAHRRVADELVAYKRRLVARYNGEKPSESDRMLIKEEEMRALRTLGYIN